jgi:tetratricopeptide (TPR) repeat protein
MSSHYISSLKALKKNATRPNKGSVVNAAIGEKFNQIISLHQNGHLEEAEIEYKQFLFKHPKNADALQLLGTLYAQRMQHAESLIYFNQSLAINPNQATVLNNLGNVYSDQKMHQLALDCYDKAIQLENNYSQAWHNKGNVYFVLQEYLKAIDCYQVAIKFNPNESQNFNHLGNAQQALSMHDEALKSYQIAIQLNPSNTEVLNNQGALYQKLSQFELALLSFDQAIQLHKDNAQAHYNRGRVLKQLNRIQEAVDSFCFAIEIKPDYFEAYNNLANVLKDEKDWERAFTLYSKVIEMKPDFAQAYYNRGTLLQEFNELEQAVSNYEVALSLEPDYADAHLNLGLVYLMLQNYAKGWTHYDWRFKSERFSTKRFESIRPQWNAFITNPSSKRLLIWSEQGVGDELMFCSLLSEFVSQLENTLVQVQVDERLLPLMSRSINNVEFISKDQKLSDHNFDEQMPLGYLAAFLRPSLESFSRQTPSFLLPDVIKAERLIAQLRPQLKLEKISEHDHQDHWLIGISWRSSAPKTGKQRSLTLEEMATSLHSPGVRLISLQYGDVRDEIETCYRKTGIQIEEVTSVDNFFNLDGLASLMHVCDEIVSVDNATVHLAASLGLRTKVLLPFHPDWRWGLSTSKSVWYPSVELFRQNVPGDWRSVLLDLENSMKIEVQL